MGETGRGGQALRTCWQGVCQVQEREWWQWHTILWRSSLAADAASRGYKKPQQRSQTPSGDKGGGKSQKQCDWCSKCNGCTGEKGTCPAWGRECGFCNGKNHYRAVCWKAAQGQKGRWTPIPVSEAGESKSPGKSHGKAKAKPAHSVVFKMVPSAKGIVSGMEERA